MGSLPSFAVIADPHVYRVPGIQDQHLRMALTAAETAGAAFVVLAGDIVEDGHRLCYENARRVLQESRLPLFPNIGNKEVSQNSTHRYRRYFGDLYYTVEHSGYRLIVLGLHNFTLPPHRMRWLRRVLQDTAPHDHTIIVAHHYLQYFTDRSRNEFIGLCEQHGVRHFITAHAHRPKVTRYGGLTEYLLQAVDPDKALESLPGFTMCRLDGENLQMEFVPVTIPAAAVQKHFVDQLGLAPAADWGPVQTVADLAARYKLTSYQLRIGGPQTYPVLAEEAEAARNCGLQLVGHLPGPQFDESGRFLNGPEMRSAVDFCVEQTSPLLVLHPPKLPADVLCDHYGRLNRNALAVARVIETYAKMVGRMESLGMTVALENNSSKKPRTTFGGLPTHLADLAGPLRERGLDPGYCFDIGHARASIAQAQISEWMAALGDRLLALHIHQGDPHTHTTHEAIHDLFSWTRWYGLGAWLAYKNVTVPCLLEMDSAKAAVASVEALKSLVDEVAT